MIERDFHKKLKKHYEKQGIMAYKPPDTWAEMSGKCKHCGSGLVCDRCGRGAGDDPNQRFTPYKPADIALVSQWIEVKTVKARTEKGMNFRINKLNAVQTRTMEKYDGLVGVGFVQVCKPEKDKSVGLYLIRWAKISGKEVWTRAELRDLAETIVEDVLEVVPVKVEKVTDPVFEYLGEE